MNRRHLLLGLARSSLAGLFAARAFSPAHAVLHGTGRTIDADLDIAVMRAAMGIHPGIYRYQETAAAHRELAAFEASYRAALQRGHVAGAYLALSRYLATLRCGHSYANFFNQNDDDVVALFDRKTRLPFWFRWVGDRMIVTRDTGGLGLTPGSEVERVNGVRAADLLAALMPFTRGDGSNDGKRRALLSVQGHEDYETFDIFQGLVAPPGGDGLHHVALRLPTGRHVDLALPPIDLAQRRAAMTRVPDSGDRPRWTWEERRDGVCLLTMPGWAMWNSQWNWRQWLEERLDSLAGARGLVIDIRDNEGGDDCGDPIVARLINRPLAGWPFETRIRFTQMPALLRDHSTTWDDRFYALGDGAISLGGGEWRPREDAVQNAIGPSSKRITCPVAALIGPTNSSATFGFINAARASGKFRLFGETTGGNRRSINGGAFLFVKLPSSGIVFDLPLKGYVSRTPQPDRGIDPDVQLPFDPAWIGAEADPVVEAAAQWCVASGNPRRGSPQTAS
ncbi:hypothetical protein GGR88_001759 [Sphingomonas jejuensis]|uniref:Tail specific protease domain-containing protein n=1 Tax=Sphingomonas jejuensis TaxID=904715 RepID=A0ABX0XLZ9_9SPHN|nr:S41 family peptidase [Sphingomonas jejuensis]NJC34285.1 hypothetical protein [Sphingomonas jejuensis]